MARAAHRLVSVLLLAAASACGGRGSSAPYAVSAAVGTYDDGSGRLGVAALATVRGADGVGPDAPWALALARDGSTLGGPVVYPAGAAYAIAAWPEAAPTSGASYRIIATGGAGALEAPATLADATPLPVPQVILSPDGMGLAWGDVVGAAAFSCAVTSGGAIQAQQVSAAPACDLAALPEGAYEATVLALGADPAALGAAVAPPMPAGFSASQASLGVLRRSAGASLALRAAGGRIDYGLVPGLAIWVGLAAADGAAAGGDWAIEVTGPGLPAADPLRFDLPANFTKRVVWSYGAPPEPGRYTLTASDGVDVITTRFVIAPPAPLPLPQGVAATASTKGAAHVTWAPVSGARSYLVSAWLGSGYVAGQWVTGTSADFPAGTFAAGATYDVYVAAADADVVAGPPPTRLSVSENTYSPARFTAP